jgi:hypothetical protein
MASFFDSPAALRPFPARVRLIARKASSAVAVLEIFKGMPDADCQEAIKPYIPLEQI